MENEKIAVDTVWDLSDDVSQYGVCWQRDCYAHLQTHWHYLVEVYEFEDLLVFDACALDGY